MKLFVRDDLLTRSNVDIWGEWWPERQIALAVSDTEIDSDNSRLLCHIGDSANSDALISLKRNSDGSLECNQYPDLRIFTFFCCGCSYAQHSLQSSDDISFALERARHLTSHRPENAQLRTAMTLVLSVVSYFLYPVFNPFATRLRWAYLPTHIISAFRGTRKLPSLVFASLKGDSWASMDLKGRLVLHAVDLLLGVAAAWLIIFYPEPIVNVFSNFYFYLNRVLLTDLVHWLTGSPAGLQMNKNLASFLGTISLTTVDLWHTFVNLVITVGAQVNLWRIIFGFVACGGLSTLVAALVDVSTFLFFHIYFQYVGVTRLWATGISAIRTMFLLFRGKKLNILKQRVDSHSFDLEQLLLGTVFFSMFVFLVPTVLVFYLAYTVIWLTVVCMQICMWATATALIEFPLLQLIQAAKGELRSGVFLQAVPSDVGVPVLRVHGRLMGIWPVVRKFQVGLLNQIPLDVGKALEAVISGSSIVRLQFRLQKSEIQTCDENLEITQLGRQIFLTTCYILRLLSSGESGYCVKNTCES